MRVMIKIPEDMWEKIQEGYVPLGISKYLKNGTILPQNPTNGDMIKAVFPDIALYEKKHDAIEISFNGVWWNAPYKRSTDADSD